MAVGSKASRSRARSHHGCRPLELLSCGHGCEGWSWVVFINCIGRVWRFWRFWRSRRSPSQRKSECLEEGKQNPGQKILMVLTSLQQNSSPEWLRDDRWHLFKKYRDAFETKRKTEKIEGWFWFCPKRGITGDALPFFSMYFVIFFFFLWTGIFFFKQMLL